MNKKRKIFFLSLLIITFLSWAQTSQAAEYFDWAMRTDRDAKPAGAYETTPFPIDENSTTYTIRNDENPAGKEYTLGTKLYVAKTGANSGNCQSFAAPCLTIGYAISQTTAGNYTIIVRAGTYFENNLTPKTGLSDAQRWMIVGYGQERPVIDGNQSLNDIFNGTGQTEAFVTLQRLKLQNNMRNGIRLGDTNLKQDGHFNSIDLETENILSTLHSPSYGDGPIYYLNADNGWIFHVTTRRSVGHCIKMGDGADNGIIEWSEASECGYWSTMVADLGITNWITQAGNAHPSGIDLPNDPVKEEQNAVVRYNIVHDTLWYGVQLRNTSNISFHHNEVYSTAHWDDVPGISCATNGVSTCPQVLLFDAGGCFLSGNIYANVIHDSADAETSGIGVNGLCDGQTVNIYNNIIYNNNVAAIYLRGYLEPTPGSTRSVAVYNNTLWQNNAGSMIQANMNWATNEVEVAGNIFHQAGSGTCTNLDADIARDYNLYFYPAGSRGSASGTHDIASGASTDPLWANALPWGSWNMEEGAVQTGSPAINAFPTLSAPTGLFTDSFSDNTRPQGSAWDIGAYEFVAAGDVVAPSAPSNLSVV